jgi:hypothetical protein
VLQIRKPSAEAQRLRARAPRIVVPDGDHGKVKVQISPIGVAGVGQRESVGSIRQSRKGKKERTGLGNGIGCVCDHGLGVERRREGAASSAFRTEYVESRTQKVELE